MPQFPPLDSKGSSGSSQSYRSKTVCAFSWPNLPEANVIEKTCPERDTQDHDLCTSCDTDPPPQTPVLSWGLGDKGPCCLRGWVSPALPPPSCPSLLSVAVAFGLIISNLLFEDRCPCLIKTSNFESKLGLNFP